MGPRQPLDLRYLPPKGNVSTSMESETDNFLQEGKKKVNPAGLWVAITAVSCKVGLWVAIRAVFLVGRRKARQLTDLVLPILYLAQRYQYQVPPFQAKNVASQIKNAQVYCRLTLRNCFDLESENYCSKY